ncbi:MAG: alpha/beta hydrolase [Deltaproteobacteria bacterium]|nr:alpha/beta hydrolase [Deltaproteobacteria bacterium]
MRLPPREEREHLRLAVELSKTPVAEIALPERRHAVVGGFRLHYLDWGVAGRPPILFLHGGALNAHTWDVVCLALRADYHCFALDQRGHGDSEWSPVMDYDPEAHCRDIAGLADQLGLERFLLVGQSMGALNAFTYACEHGERLRGLVLIDAGPNVRAGGARRIGEFVGATAEIDSIEEAMAKALEFNPLRDPRLLRRGLLYNYRRLPSGKWARKHDMRHWVGVDIAERAARHRERWGQSARVTCPALVVRGALSDVFHDEDAENFVRALPNARWTRIEGAGHTVQGDNPRGLCEALRAFFAELA